MEERQNFSQAEVDLMFWQYCIGVLQLMNALETGSDDGRRINEVIGTMNDLAKSRRAHLEKTFHRWPSFDITYHTEGKSGYHIEKKS